MARRPARGTRERILHVAARLFRENGVRAVGLQQVIDDTGLGKSLLYREFSTKDDLVAAWLREGREGWWRSMAATTAPLDGDPAGQLLAVMELAAEAVAAEDFRGCIFHNTSIEFRDPEHPAHQEAVLHLRQLRDHLRQLGAEAAASDPDELADGLMLIMDGMYASGGVLGAAGPARMGLPLSRILIQTYCRQAQRIGD